MCSFLWAITVDPISWLTMKEFEEHSGSFTIEELSANRYKLSGEIGFSDCERFKSQINVSTRIPVTLYLESPGGAYIEGLCIADHVKSNNMITIVDNTLCASACTYIFLGGKKRVLKGNARFGIHNPGTPGEFLRYASRRQIEFSSFRSAGKLTFALERLGLIDVDARSIFYVVPHESIFWLHPSQFEEHPGYESIATNYIDFWGYNKIGTN